MKTIEFERAQMQLMDGPDHRRVRSAARRTFTPRGLAEMRPSIERLGCTL